MNCKPGDLAYVRERGIGDKAAGMVVEVMRDSPHWTAHFGFQCWLCTSKSPIPCRKAYSRRDTVGNEVVFADSDLVPITGLPIDEETRDEVPA